MIKFDKIIRTRFILNDEPIYSHDPKVILQTIFTSVPDIACWSPEALREFIIGTFQMVHDFGVHIKQELKDSASPLAGDVSKKFSRFSSWSTKALKFLPKDRERLIHFVFNIIMSCEGKGLLPGFGMSNKHKDSIPGNPEKKSIYSLPIEIPVRRERDDDILGGVVT